MTGIEPVTSSLPRKRSTPELHRHYPGEETMLYFVFPVSSIIKYLPPTPLYPSPIKMQSNRVSGKRDSNSRPQPWKGCALPTELFPHYIKNIPSIIIPGKTYALHKLHRGERRIRTSEGVRQQIYSLLQLTALVSPLR